MADATGSQVALWRTSTTREQVNRSNHDHRHPHPERRTAEGLPQQRGCGVFKSRRDQSQHGGNDQVDQREGDQEDTGGDHPQERQPDLSLYGEHKHLSIQPHASSSLVEFKVVQISMDVKLIISEVDRYHEPEQAGRVCRRSRTPTQQSTTRVGALTAHHPAWVSHHTGGSRSIPTVQPCSRMEGGCG